MNRNILDENTIVIDENMSMATLRKYQTNKDIAITRDSLNSQIEIDETCVLKNVRIKIIGSNSKLTISKGTKLIDCDIYIHNNNNSVYIGKECDFNGASIWCCDENNEIYIGDKTTIYAEIWGNTVIYACEGKKISLGKDCMLSGNISIRTSDGHAIINRNGERLNVPKDVSIGNHVWIGMNAMILKGCKIGDGSVIGANSVVTHSYENYTMIAGNPAKAVSDNHDFDWLRDRNRIFTSEDFRKNI